MGRTHRHWNNHISGTTASLQSRTTTKVTTKKSTNPVRTTILGLDTITTNNLKLEIQIYSEYLCNEKVQVRLRNIGHHFYIKAAMVNGYYRKVDYTGEFAKWYDEGYDDFKKDNMAYGIGNDGDPNIPVYGLHFAQRRGADQTGNYKTQIITTT
eukprot:5902950-Amphidinium_carterae.1